MVLRVYTLDDNMVVSLPDVIVGEILQSLNSSNIATYKRGAKTIGYSIAEIIRVGPKIVWIQREGCCKK